MVKSLFCLMLLLVAAEDEVSEEVKQHREQVARAARMYRIEVYESFRLDRDEYNRRREIGDAIESAWRSCDQTAQQAELATKWFEESRELVFDQGAKAEFAAAPELPAKIVPEETPANPSLVSAEGAAAVSAEAQTTSAPASESQPLTGDSNSTAADAAASTAAPATEQSAPPAAETPAAASTELLNSIGQAIAEGAAAAVSTSEGSSETAEATPALTPMPMEREIPKANKSEKKKTRSSKSKNTKKSAQGAKAK